MYALARACVCVCVWLQAKELEEMRDVAQKQRAQAVKGLEMTARAQQQSAGRESDKFLHQQLKKQRRVARAAQTEVRPCICVCVRE